MPGGRKKGTAKTGGRKKGTPNVVTRELRERIEQFLKENWEAANDAWVSIQEPKDKLRLYIDLAKFAIPSLQAVSLDATLKKEDSVEDDLKELAGRD